MQIEECKMSNEGVTRIARINTNFGTRSRKELQRNFFADKQRKRNMNSPLRMYWLLAFGITWGAGGIALVTGNLQHGAGHTLHPLHYLAALGPSIAGFIMAAATKGWAGVRHLLASLVPAWMDLPWYAAVILGFPAASLAAAWLLDRDSLAALPSWGRLICLVPITLVLDTGPLGEEFGWRGFALPRLLRRWPPLTAALVLGVIWWAWHLPTFFINALSQSHLAIPLFFVNALALSVLMTGLYLRTRGDLLLMIVIHVMANWCPVPFRSEVCAEVVLAILMLWAGWLQPKVRPDELGPQASESFTEAKEDHEEAASK
jgi:membrane protease YdiL (CAAX protease family)